MIKARKYYADNITVHENSTKSYVTQHKNFYGNTTFGVFIVNEYWSLRLGTVGLRVTLF